MGVTLKAAGRTREVTGALVLERWIQLDSGVDIIYGSTELEITGDLNTLDAKADSSITTTMWYGAPSPGRYGYDSETKPSWYGLEIRIPFRRLQASGEWENLLAELRAFVESAFPDESPRLIEGPNRRMQRPAPSDVGTPARFWLWAVEYDE